MPSIDAGAATAEPQIPSIKQCAAPTLMEWLHDDPQPNITRSKSSNFHAQYSFIRDKPGSLNDEYLVHGQALGKGSFGSAHIAMCKATGFMRAVKTIRVEREKVPKRLETEILIAKQLDHPNVVRLFETFHDGDALHLVMELCTGGELFDRIVAAGSDGVGEPTAAKYVNWMMAAISYMHARNICHRDVKPENFIFQNNTQDAQLKCIDFGLSRVFEPGKAMTTRVGTPYYVAPEVLKGSYDARCDVWSVGAIAYLMLCGRVAFGGSNDKEILKKVRKGIVEFKARRWDSISGDAKDAVMYMMTLNASERPTAAQVMDESWVQEAGCRGRPAAEVPDVVGRLEQFRRHARMKRVALTAVAQQLPESETERLGELFRRMDRDGDGELSVEEVRRGVEAQGIQAPEALEEIFSSVDVNGSGRLDYTEFVAAMMDDRLLGQRDLCCAAFRAFDLDGDGIITRSELGQVLHSGSFGSSPSPTISEDRIDNMIREVDGNGDGGIDFREFCAMLSQSSGGASDSGASLADQAPDGARSPPPSYTAAEKGNQAGDNAQGRRGFAARRIRGAISSARGSRWSWAGGRRGPA